MTPPPPGSERRFADRRRARRVAPAEESWFGSLGGLGEAAFGGAADIAGNGEGDSDSESRTGDDLSSLGAAAQTADRPAGQTAFERIYRAFIAARAALGVALVVALGVVGLFGLRPTEAVVLLSISYAGLSIGMWLLPRSLSDAAPASLARLSSPLWLATIGIDLVFFTALHVLAAGSSLNYVALLVLPVLMAAVLTPRGLARATAAVVTLVLLGTAWRSVLAGAEATSVMMQAALTGIGLFVITIVAGELAGRLAREELSARGSLRRARQQEQLNRLVIEEMQDGVLVVDRRGWVRAANPSARRLLTDSGMSEPAPFQLRGVAAWAALVKMVERAFGEVSWPEAGRDVVLQFESRAQRTLRARIRFTRQIEHEASQDLCVLFLEDVRNMQARSRQEKLAAMGRVSAGIAHEIRNPLAAISQANALLAEDATDADQRRLTRMVGENVERLKRIVDDVMEVAPGQLQEAGVIDAAQQVAVICSEWARAAGVRLGDAALLRVDLPSEPLGVVFDAEHLRRVVVNLLDNARRHASAAPGAIQVRLDSRHDAQAFLSIASDGEPIPPDVEPYLFEPFFSTRSRGTGLGLYICRELCERYGATIDYRLRTDGPLQRNEFYVDMRRRPLVATDARLHLNS
jgi:two-component system sensor histidine kinase PilS (NtrC family)